MGPNKLKSRVVVRLPGPEEQGSGNCDEDTGHRLVSSGSFSTRVIETEGSPIDRLLYLSGDNNHANFVS